MSNYNQLILGHQNGSWDSITITGNTIGSFEYQGQDICYVEVPECVEEIGEYAFCDNFLSSITLNEGLQIIGDQAFQHGTYSSVTIPSTVAFIGENSFNIYEEQSDMWGTPTAGDLYITCLAAIPPMLEDGEGRTFGDPSKLHIRVPDGSVNEYKASWPQYASIIQGGAVPPTPPTPVWTFEKAYVGDAEVEKCYLGNILVYSAGTGPVPPEPSYSAMPLTFEILSDGDILWRATNTAITRTIEYSKNSGEWTSITSTTEGATISVNNGDIVQFRGDNSTYAINPSTYSSFRGSTCSFKLKGNIMSLIDSTGFTTATTLYSSNTFCCLFRQITGLTDASNLVLPATTVTQGCYHSMFQGCTSLTTAPELPATTLAQTCYYSMFQGCTSLTTAPELPATVSQQMCYNGMFQGCTSLTTPPSELPITTLKGGEYNGMFNGCSSLQKSPKILATNLVGNSAAGMFNNCSNLNEVYCLATAIAQYSTSWLTNVSATGTFYKDPNATIWAPGQNGIPAGWTVKSYYEDCWNNWQEEGFIDYEDCTCFKYGDCS